MAIWQKGGVKGRIKLKNRSGIDAKVTIFDVRGDEATLGNTSVLLEDISLEGLQFLSYLRFPVNTDYRLRFTITLGEWEFALLVKSCGGASKRTCSRMAAVSNLTLI